MKIFISYSHKDAVAFSFLLAGMNPYIKSKVIQAWYDRYLLAGDVYDPIIKSKMEESDIIILLISFNFTNSDYIFDNEVPIAVEKFKKGARIIPIILESCPYEFLNDKEYFGSNINVLPRTPVENMFRPVAEWEKEAWTIITNQLLRIIKNADLNSTGPANQQPNTVSMPEQNGKILNNPGHSNDADIQHPNHPINNIFTASYTVPGNLLAVKNEQQESIYFDEKEKNDITYIFNSILGDDKNSAEIQGLITKIRLEDPDKAGIRKKCVVVGALTISLLRKFDRERLLMLIDFIEDKEPGLWERALVGMVLALGDRFKELDGQIKRKLQWLRNDQAIQESITNLFYVLYFRSISAEEILYKNREGFLNITFFQNQANWFLPFTHEDIPEDLIKKNEVYNYADNAIFLKDDNIKFLTFIQYHLLGQEGLSELEDNLQKERELRNNIFGGGQPGRNLNSDRTIQNYMAMLFSFIYIHYPDEWSYYKGIFPWQEEQRDLVLDDIYRIKMKAIIADSVNDVNVTSGLYDDFLAKSGSTDAGALRYYGYYCIYLKDYEKALDKLLSAFALDPLNVNLNSQIAYTYMMLPEPNYTEALKYLGNSIVFDPLNTWCYKNMGICYQKILPLDLNRALEYYLKAYTYEKDDFWLLNKIGACYQNIEKPDFEKSREFLEKAVNINDKDFGTLSDLGYANQWVINPDFSKALEYHLAAFALEDSNVWNIKNIGYCYMQAPAPVYKKAIRYFMMALEDNMTDSWALFKIAFCYQSMNPPDYTTALEYYLKGYEIEGAKSNVEKNIGICYINCNLPDYKKAKEFLEMALDKIAGDPDIFANLGYCWQLTEPRDYNKALEYHLKAYEIDKKYTWNTKNIGHCYINISTPDYKEALRFLLIANEETAKDDWILKRIGYCYQCLEKPDYEKALEYHLQAYEINNSDIWNIQNVATCYSSLPNPDSAKALEFLLIAYALDPRDMYTLINIGLNYQDIDPPDWRQALEFHLKALEVVSDDFWTLQNVGFCYQKLPEPDHLKALEYYQRAEKIKPDDFINLTNMGVCYQNMTPPRYEEALQYYLKAQALNPEDAQVLIDIASCYENISPPDLEKAQESLLKAYAMKPDDGVVMEQLAYCYQDIIPADYEKSYTFFEMASKKNLPADSAFEMNWGWTCLMLNKLDESEIHLLRGLELAPAEFAAYFNLGHIEMLRNNPEKAKGYYKLRFSNLKSQEEFLEMCRKDFSELEPLGLNKEIFDKVITEVIES